MASLLCTIMTSLIICAMLREGCGLPLSGQDRAQAPHPRQIRTKRCSCNSWDDKECIYFCHLDIIWVNTPSKVLPYGLGNPVSRRRRSAGRCECKNSADKTCYSFCRTRSDSDNILAGSTSPSSANSNRWLMILRSAVTSRNEMAKQNLSPNKKFIPVNQFKTQTQR